MATIFYREKAVCRRGGCLSGSSVSYQTYIILIVLLIRKSNKRFYRSFARFAGSEFRCARFYRRSGYRRGYPPQHNVCFSHFN